MGYVGIGLFLVRNWRLLVIVVPILLMLPLLLVFAPFAKHQSTSVLPEGGVGGKAVVSQEVRRYEPLVRKYAEQYGVAGYTEILLAKMMQESGGRGGDPMQASESLGLPPNTIQNPIVSIDAGVKYFSKMLKKAKGDIKLTLQAYNFGGGFIPYALERGGYSKEVAAAFSAMMEEKTGWDRYGDINYVENVLRYFEGSAVAVGADPNSYGFIKPIDTKITSEYGTRIDPFTGLPNTHFGTDFSCNRSNPPIVAVKSGTVTRAGWQNPSNHSVGFGQRIYIDHGNGLITVYAHLSDISVKPGQTVSQGQQIGLCGTTGSSTGEHLHLELHQNGRKLNPRGRIF